MTTIESVTSRKNELVKGLDPFVKTQLKYLAPTNKIWQPADLLPDSSSPTFVDEIIQLRQRAAQLSDETLVALVGASVTEEALPSYMAWMTRSRAIQDETGTDQTGWAQWARGWTAEEHRHEIVLDRYLTLTGRVKMQAVDRTVQYLIKNGFNTGTNGDIYEIAIYPAIQEPATSISHMNEGKRAEAEGEPTLAKICSKTAGDERRHASFYAAIVGELFHQDPEGATIAYRNIIKRTLVMPGARMDDEGNMTQDAKRSKLFHDFSLVTQKIGIYTVGDYMAIIHKLSESWNIFNLHLSGEAAKAQEEIGRFQDKRTIELFSRLQEKEVRNSPSVKFSWIHDREINLAA